MHQPARPHRSPRFQRTADRELRADFLQAGRASPQGGRNAPAANRQLHTAHRPRIHRPVGKHQAYHPGSAQRGMVRIFQPESRALRFHAVPCDQPEQRMADRNGRGSCLQRNESRRGGQKPHRPLPRHRSPRQKREVRQHKEPATLQRSEREVRYEGVPASPGFNRTGVQKRPHAPPQAPAGEHCMEARQTGRSISGTADRGNPVRNRQHALQMMQAVL